GDAGRAYDLNGNPLDWFIFTRSTFRDYLVNAGKTAIDLGTNYFMLDNASLNLGTLSFDSEIISAFQDYLSENYTVEELASMGVSDVSTFDYADYLKSAEGGSYTDTDSLNDNIPGDDLWYAWIEAVKGVERAFYEQWTSELRNYALSTYSREIYLGANRSVGPNQWANIDKLDYAMSETFIDTLGYPYYNLDHVYKNARNFNKRFWSWGFPANTGEFNGSGDPYGRLHITELSKLFLSETLAAGGLHQIPIDWVSYYHEDARLVPLQPYYEFARSHPELFNLSEAGEVAVLYNEAFEKADTSNYTPGYLGIMMLLADSHRPFDVVFAGDPEARDGVDPFSTTDLSAYKAIILPNAQMLTDSQVSQLESYLNGGGTLIGLGQIANQDENGNDVSSSRTLDDYFTLDGTSTVGSGLAICFTANLGDNYHGNSATNIGPYEYDWEVTAQNLSDTADFRSTWSSVVDSQLSQDFASTSLPSTVHLHRYEDSFDGSHIYQIVNRDINMTESVDDQTMNTTSDTACSVAIPEGFTGGTVTLSWMTVEEPNATELSFIVNGDQLEFTLPGFNIWGILKVGSEAESPTSIDETPEANFNLLDSSSGYRPDKLESSGIFEYNNKYWKGGNHGSLPWDIPYWATDDNEVDLIRLYYRFSTDRETWGSWALHQTKDVSGTNISDTISFNAPDGEGHYQFRIQAVDDQGQEEYVDASRDETAYGVDETAPEAPTNVVEASHESGTWIEDPSSLTFSWDTPVDNLSGHSGANVTVATHSTIITEESLGSSVNTWSPSLTGLVNGERYMFSFRNEDEAGNWSDTYTPFTFRYGTLPVADPISPSVTEGDGQLTVDWTNPSDVNFSNVIVYYREAGDVYATWTSGPQSPDSSATSLDLTGLSNETAYQIRISSVSTGLQEGNEIIIDGSFTPQAGLGGGGSESTELEAPTDLTLEDNTANVRLEWTDNASDETGYVIEKRLQGDTSWTTVATAGMNAQAFVDNTNIGSDTWEYRVKAIRDSESSSYTLVVSITRTSGGGSSSTPNAPANLNASDIGTEVELSWDDLSSNETNFVIERRLLGDSSWSTSLTRPANTTQFSDLTATEGNTYEYRIKAINGGAHSAYSNIVSVIYTGAVQIANFTVDGVTTTVSIDTLSGRIYKLYVSEDLESWSIFGTRVG
ncbi:MAG: fibronectin type III domain-containing protein, partial [Verrucomicrobiota bacterium]|nr:fibronectin type III domain-containing protein [Verrucomicrobiota bacterium]